MHSNNWAQLQSKKASTLCVGRLDQKMLSHPRNLMAKLSPGIDLRYQMETRARGRA